mmetsp:Transcript_20166/g.58308  ORF Transcript_20166/g.58308 Transcript_20166/m.58308 type:complete len:104 (-) Transcript_20166:1003-1314(-)
MSQQIKLLTPILFLERQFLDLAGELEVFVQDPLFSSLAPGSRTYCFVGGLLSSLAHGSRRRLKIAKDKSVSRVRSRMQHVPVDQKWWLRALLAVHGSYDSVTV